MSTPDQNDGIAARLRAARLQRGLEIDVLARELKNPRAVLEAIERGDWSRLGAPVFARHLVGRYASRLGVGVDLDEIARRVEAPVLRPQVSTSRLGRVADVSMRHAAYVGGTLLVLPLVYLALSSTASGPTGYRPLDPAPVAVPAAGRDDVPADAPAATLPADAALAAAGAEAPGLGALPAGGEVPPSDTPAAAPTTVAASLAGVLPGSRQLELRFTGDSWIEVFGRDGAVVERVLAKDGETRAFAAAEVGRVTIGNVDATEVVLDGSRVNLDAVRAANVARFALSSDGSIEAVAR